jgi:hypothetical protein
VIPRASGPVFMFCAPRLIFGGIKGDMSRFRQYRGRRVPLSCFSLPDSFSMAPGVAGPFFMFCAPRLVFGGTWCDMSRFHVLRFHSRFRRYRGCRLLFSCFTLLDTFSAVRRASGFVFMFCTLELVFGGSEGVGSHIHVLRARTRFWRYRGRRVPFSYFALLDSFLAIPRWRSRVRHQRSSKSYC